MSKNTNVGIDEAQYKILKSIAFLKNKSVKSLVALAISDFIASNTTNSLKEIEKMKFNDD